MRDFEKAKELFKDTIDTKNYFDSVSAELAKNRILDAIEERNAPLIFIVGDPGVGKSYILKLVESALKKRQITVFIDHPFFDKRDLLKMLYSAKKLDFDPNINFNTLKDELVRHYKGTGHTIFIDEAQLLNEEQFELIRILSDTKIFQFALSMHKEEGQAILQKKHFKSRTKTVVNIDSLQASETYRYIQDTLNSNSYPQIATLFKERHVKKINRFTKGNFRTVKKYLYTLFNLLDYAKKNGLAKYQNLNSCILAMTALEIGLINDK